MALPNLVAGFVGRLVRLWQENDPIEVMAAQGHLATGFQYTGVYKIDGLNVLDKRTGLDKRWKVYCNGSCLHSFDTEAEADTWIRKLHDAINTAEGTGTIKRCADL